MALSIALLGPPRVERDGAVVTFDTRKAMALLAHLAIADRPRSRDSLCELLWPSHAPDRSRGALRRTLSTLRSGIGDEWLETAGDTIAVRHAEGLGLDVGRFRDLAGDGARVEDLERAVTLFAGEFMEGFGLRDSVEFDLWQTAEADRLRRELGAALGRLVDSLSMAGQDQRALPHAQRRLAIDPLHEPAHRDLIRLLARTGERAAALDQYRECVRVLSRELGVPPTEETAALFEQLTGGGVPAIAPAAPARPAASRPAPPAELPLTGRHPQLARLMDLYGAAMPDGRLAFIEGEAGIGKTRLVAELTDRVRAAGGAVLATRCLEDESGVPYGPIAELLRGSLARRANWEPLVGEAHIAHAALLAPELGRLPPPPDGPGARGRLLGAVATVLSATVAGPAPGLIAIDDLHLADEATLDAVSYLARRMPGRPLLLAVTWRSEAVLAGHRLRRLAADLARQGESASIRLERLSQPEVAELVKAVAPDAESEGRAFLESEGLPLFVAEYLAVLRSDGAAQGITSEVRDVLGTRIAALPATTHQVLGAAAVIGRSFTLAVAREASGRAHGETVGALDELLGRGIVIERAGAEPSYEFSHEKLRELVLTELSQARTRLLHGRVARALAASPHPPSGSAVIAQHLALAGDPDAAAREYRLAGEHAASVHAHSDAVDHLERALALGDADSAGLNERIGDLRTLMGEYAAALAAYETAAAQTTDARVAGVERKLGAVHHRRGDWARAEARLRTALEAAAHGDPALRARIQGDLSLTLEAAGRPDEATVLAQEALALAEAVDDRAGRAQAHNMLGMLAREAGELDSARAELARSLELAEEIGAPEPRVAALNNLALAMAATGETCPRLSSPNGRWSFAAGTATVTVRPRCTTTWRTCTTRRAATIARWST